MLWSGTPKTYRHGLNRDNCNGYKTRSNRMEMEKLKKHDTTDYSKKSNNENGAN